MMGWKLRLPNQHFSMYSLIAVAFSASATSQSTWTNATKNPNLTQCGIIQQAEYNKSVQDRRGFTAEYAIK